MLVSFGQFLQVVLKAAIFAQPLCVVPDIHICEDQLLTLYKGHLYSKACSYSTTKANFGMATKDELLLHLTHKQR